jgi:hypothetical protein
VIVRKPAWSDLARSGPFGYPGRMARIVNITEAW